MIIETIGVGKVPRKVLEEVTREVAKVYSLPRNHCFTGPSLEIPPGAYNPHRGQYNADIIVDRVQHRIAGENKVLALTDVDLYTTLCDYNFIFGLAQLRGRIALVSLCRLDPVFYGKKPEPQLFLKRATKESVHELGHTIGLNHCEDPKCVMSFSNSILDVDAKSENFCAACKNKVKNYMTFTMRV